MVLSTTYSYYEYIIMAYGLSCMFSVFQNLMNDVLMDMLGKLVIAYISGILIYSPS